MANEPLLNAAARIADGEFVDWLSVTSTLPTGDERAIAEELALVAQIAQGHRQLHQILPPNADTPPNLIPDLARWGHLELLNIVGRGSYGTVYRAWDTRLERLVALKLFHGAADPEAVMQEGRMLARMRHENVVSVYGADVIDGVAGIWMELIHGRTLEHMVRKDGPMPVREAAAIGADVARALATVHAAGVLHCDVKAQNVVREASGRVVLMDFGAGRIAPEYRDADEVSDVAGTPRYMAPELFKGGSTATKATDIYSFGILLYFLVTGRFPIEGRTLGELKSAHETGAVTPLWKVRKGLPSAFVDVVTRAISHDPALRPVSATAMQEALDHVVERAKGVQFLSRWQGWLTIAVVIAGLAFFANRSMFTPAPAENMSIAVLPIRNLSGDPSAADLTDALTETLIANLARLKDLRVPSYAAVAPMKDRTDSPAAMTEALGVKLLLAGTVLQVDPILRVSVQLIDPSGRAVWGEEIRGSRNRIVAAETEFVRKLAERLGLALPADENQRLAQLALDPRAEEAYLRGLTQSLRAPAEPERAAADFRLVTELAPDFAPAWAELALVDLFLVEAAPANERAARFEAIRAAAEHAIQLDPTLAKGYAARGLVEFNYDWNFAAAEATFRKGIEVAPNDGLVRQRLALLFAAQRRLGEALAHAREARALEPLIAQRSVTLGTVSFYARDYRRAAMDYQSALAIEPNSAVAHFGLGRVLAEEKRYPDALAAFERALSQVRYPQWLAEYARVLILSGRQRDAERIIAEINQGDAKPYADQWAHIALAQGNRDEAIAALERAVAERTISVLWLAVDPRLDPVRNDPRFDRLLARIGLR